MIWLWRSDPINISLPYSQIADLNLTLCFIVIPQQQRIKSWIQSTGTNQLTERFRKKTTNIKIIEMTLSVTDYWLRPRTALETVPQHGLKCTPGLH